MSRKSKLLLAALVIVLAVAWVIGDMFVKGRYAADQLCALAKPGLPIDVVIDQAHEYHVDFLDDRLMRNAAQSKDGYLMSLTSPFTVRRTCTITFHDGAVVSVKNEAGPN